MADESKPRSRGCFARLFTTFLFLTAVAFGVALYFVSQPQDLSDINGYGVATGPAKRDLGAVLRSATERGYDLKLSEAEINGWLKDALVLKQGGLLAEGVKMEGVAIRLKKDLAEVVLERSVFGRPFTVSMFLRIEQSETADGVSTALHREGGPFLETFPKLRKGGRFGKLVVPQGLLLLVMPSFRELGDQFKDEISNGFEKMARVRFEEKNLVLDPRGAVPPDMVPPGTF